MAHLHFTRRACRLVLTLGIIGFAPAFLRAGEWPGYRGPNQDGISAETLALPWSAQGPKVVWKAPTPTGFSSFAVSDGKAFTQITREVGSEVREICVALDAATGKELWFADVDAAHYDGGGDAGTRDNSGGDGPRSTPAVSEGKVYVFSPHLTLFCFDAQSGKKVWVHDLAKENAGRNIGWKNAASPVVDGDLVFVAGGGAGQSLLGLDKKTGKVVWKAHDEMMTHATPVITNLLNQRQVIFFMQKGLLAVDPKDGKALWRFPFAYRTSTAASPVVDGDIVYCSAGYGVGGGACKITKDGDHFTATELWKIPGDKKVANHWSTPVAKDGYLYGMFSFKKFGSGPMKCVELLTGKIMWEQPGFGAGNVILAGDKVIALADDGHVVIVEAQSTAYKEVARAKVIEGKCWSTPALSDGRLYIRGTQEGACVEVGGK